MECNRCWCSDGYEFCCDREIIDWAASTGGYDKEMVGGGENASGRNCQKSRLEWLADNSLVYRAHETRVLARLSGLEPCLIIARSHESNGIADGFVETIKRDDISIMLKPDSGDESGGGVQSLQRIHP